MNPRYLHIRNPNNPHSGFTVCFTLPKDNGTTKIQFAISGTNYRRQYDIAVLQGVVENLDFTDLLPEDFDLSDNELKVALFKRLMLRQHEDQFCKKTGRRIALANYNTKRLFSDITWSDLVTNLIADLTGKGLNDVAQTSFDVLPPKIVNAVVMKFATEFAKQHLPMFLKAK